MSAAAMSSPAPTLDSVGFTPGPWTADGADVLAKVGHVTFFVHDYSRAIKADVGEYEAKANATLIAAAPDLYAAINDALLQIEDGPNDCSGTMSDGTRVWKGSFLRRVEAMRDALAKAEGRSR